MISGVSEELDEEKQTKIKSGKTKILFGWQRLTTWILMGLQIRYAA